MSAEGLFAAVEEFPDDRARERFNDLVGIDTIKRQLTRQAQALLDPAIVEAWSTKAHKKVIPAVRDVMTRTALVILAGHREKGDAVPAEPVGTWPWCRRRDDDVADTGVRDGPGSRRRRP